ncbi:MAG: MiaB/RimO family radical SAM methylthiotransferase, partial [Candidatus Binatia bacterium]
DKKARLLDYLEVGRPADPMIAVDNIFLQTELETFGLAGYSRHARAFVKIQDGCNQFCTFCIIPYARGRNRSIPIPRVLEELGNLTGQGFHEAVLTGIHIGTYGADLPEPSSLTALLRAIDRERPIHRVRVSSVDPEEVTEEMVELLTGSPALCPHLHIPLQSGDDATLQLMRRRYDAKRFARVCAELARRRGDFCIGTDVIVGFPYEDEARFQNTHDLLDGSPVHYLHVFPFSPKRGTRAARMLGQVPPGPKKARAEALRRLSEQKREAFYRRALDSEVEVVLEHSVESCHNDLREGQSWLGHSENYLPVTLPLVQARSGQVVRCRLEAMNGGTLVGKTLAQ